MSTYAGIDWGSATHAVCVVNERGECLARLKSRTMQRDSPSCGSA